MAPREVGRVDGINIGGIGGQMDICMYRYMYR